MILNMYILAIDTTATTATAALTDDWKLMALYTLNTGLTHSKTMLDMVENMLKNAKINVNDIGLFACAAGPGSFTGVRIGISLIKGLAFGRNAPCIPVSTLEALAENMLSAASGECLISPVMDARRSQFYQAWFSVNDGKACRVTEDRMISAEELDREMAKYDQTVYLVGDGCGTAFELLNYKKVKVAGETIRYANAYSVAVVAYRKWTEKRETAFCSDSELHPVYLRAPQAERERKSRESE